MDILKFKVKNSELQRKDKKIISNKSEETAYIQVTFQKNSDWENQTKFAIFENDKKQQTTVLLGDTQTCLIPIPAIALTGYYFIISIYAGDRLTTNFLRIGLNPSHYNTKPDSPSQIDKTIIDDIYSRLKTKYDNIEYTDGKLICYAENKLIKILNLNTLVVDELKQYVDDSINYDDYKFENNTLQCFKNGEIKKIIPLQSILENYYNKTEIDEKLNGKADSSHTHNISNVTGLSTSLDGKMSNDYSESTIESNFFAHKIGNIVIVTWWNPTLPTTQNSWVDWKTLPYESCNTQHIWVNGDGNGCEVRVRVPPNSNKLQVFIGGGTGSIRPGMIVYPTK